MSDTPELPPLPEETDLAGFMPTGFTDEQMTAFGRECWEAGRRAGLEEAAKLCLERSRGAPEAMAAEAMLCAAHIRARAEP